MKLAVFPAPERGPQYSELKNDLILGGVGKPAKSIYTQSYMWLNKHKKQFIRLESKLFDRNVKMAFYFH